MGIIGIPVSYTHLHLMPKSAHHNFRIVDKLFKFALCLLGYIPRIGVISIFNNITSGFNRHITEAIFKIAYLLSLIHI